MFTGAWTHRAAHQPTMPPRPMIDRSIHGPFDEINTPPEAIEPLVWYLMNSPSLNNTGYEPVIWEPSPGDHWLTEYLTQGHGLKVIETSGNYFDTPFPQAADILVTNPPTPRRFTTSPRPGKKPSPLPCCCRSPPSVSGELTPLSRAYRSSSSKNESISPGRSDRGSPSHGSPGA